MQKLECFNAPQYRNVRVYGNIAANITTSQHQITYIQYFYFTDDTLVNINNDGYWFDRVSMEEVFDFVSILMTNPNEVRAKMGVDSLAAPLDKKECVISLINILNKKGTL